MKKIKILLLVALGIVIGNITGIAQNSAQIIIDDMTLKSDACPHGVPPNYSWACSDAILDNNGEVPHKNFLGQWMEAMTSWGQVYIPIEGSSATNTRCQIRNLVTKFLYNDGTWVVVQSGEPQGAAFVEDFSGNRSIGAGARDESANGGGLSVIVGVGAWAGYNYHFWPTGSRAFVDVTKVIGVFTTAEARLIVDDPTKPDDRDQCKNILAIGADWWLNQSVGWLPDWSANGGIGGGRAKWVTKEWQSFNMCTRTPDQIRANPPIIPTIPVPVTGIVFNPDKISVVAGSSKLLSPVFSPANATNKNITWSSSNPNIATISASGQVSGISEGTSTITATTKDGNKTASILVTVTSLTGGVPIPAKIEAENWVAQSGVQLENTSDVGGGQNVGYIDAGDYMDYLINVPVAGDYILDLRIAANSAASFQIKQGTTVLKTVDFQSTGGYQNWKTITTTLNLTAGTHPFRIAAVSGGWNINWMEFKNSGALTAIYNANISETATVNLFPNPAQEVLNINSLEKMSSEIFNSMGQKIMTSTENNINISALQNGFYLVSVTTGSDKTTHRLEIKK